MQGILISLQPLTLPLHVIMLTLQSVTIILQSVIMLTPLIIHLPILLATPRPLVVSGPLKAITTLHPSLLVIILNVAPQLVILLNVAPQLVILHLIITPLREVLPHVLHYILHLHLTVVEDHPTSRPLVHPPFDRARVIHEIPTIQTITTITIII